MTTSMRKLLRIQAEGQITIPDDLRRSVNLKEGDLVMIEAVAEEIVIRPVHPEAAAQGSPWLRDLHAYFAPVREEARAEGYTEEEIDRAIDDAVRASRDGR